MTSPTNTPGAQFVKRVRRHPGDSIDVRVEVQE